MLIYVVHVSSDKPFCGFLAPDVERPTPFPAVLPLQPKNTDESLMQNEPWNPSIQGTAAAHISV